MDDRGIKNTCVIYASANKIFPSIYIRATLADLIHQRNGSRMS